MNRSLIFLLLGLPVCLFSCTSVVRPISFGKDNCSFCKMTIMDPRFGAEILTKKGKTFLVDDLSCIRQFIESGGIDPADIKDIYACNYNGKGELIRIREAVIVQSPAIRGPMQGQEALFETTREANEFIQKNGGKIVPSASFPGVY